MAVIVGTDGPDQLTGNWGDTVEGRGGDDYLFGGGNLFLKGGIGNDRLEAKGGSRIYGDDGDDIIVITGGISDDYAVTASGDGGRDRIYLSNGNAATMLLYGHDFLDADIYKTLFIETGGGSHTRLNFRDFATFRLGLGLDVIEVRQATRPAVTVSETMGFRQFEAGDNGDVLDLSDYLATELSGWGGANPFSAGYLRLRQINSGFNYETWLEVNKDAAGDDWIRLAEFKDTLPSWLTARNFAGYAPTGAPLQSFVIHGRTDNPIGVTGAAENDDIYGTSGADHIQGLSGDDEINGAKGDDLLEGGLGADRLRGAEGADWLYGGAGNDVFVVERAVESRLGAADTLFDFDTGIDRIELSAMGPSTRVTISQVGASSYVYSDTDGDGAQDALIVSFGRSVAGSDILTRSSFGVTLFGDAGFNGLTGSARADTFIAGEGNDTMRGGAGADAFYGGAGADTYLLGLGDSTISAIDVAYDFVSGSDRIDVSALTASGAKLVLARFGGSGFLYIDENADGNADGELIGYLGLIQGSDLAGANGLTIYGSAEGDALIRGGVGADVVAGFDGADVIVGGAGADQLYGGSGSDQFRYEAVGDSTTAAYDFIQDFEVGVDKIDLRALNTGGASTFTRSVFGGSTFVYVDQDGNGTQDFLVIAAGRTLSDSDIRWSAGSAPDAVDATDGPVVCLALNESELAWMM